MSKRGNKKQRKIKKRIWIESKLAWLRLQLLILYLMLFLDTSLSSIYSKVYKFRKIKLSKNVKIELVFISLALIFCLGFLFVQGSVTGYASFSIYPVEEPTIEETIEISSFDFEIMATPIISLLSPNNNTFVEGTREVYLTYNISDPGDTVDNCTLWLTEVNTTTLLNNLTMPSELITDNSAMVLHMHFNNDSSVDENYTVASGENIYDYSPAQNNGTLYNGGDDSSNFTSGKFGMGISYDGTNDYVRISDSPTLTFALKPFSISMWINIAANEQNDAIIGKYRTGSREWLFYIDGSSPGDLKMVVYDETNDASISTEYTTNLPLNTWTHIAATYDGGTDDAGLVIYLNGLEVPTTDATSGSFVSSRDTDATIDIGSFFESNYFKGKIDEIAIYNKSLTPAEIELHHIKGSQIHQNQNLSFNYTGNLSLIGGNYKWLVGCRDDGNSGGNSSQFNFSVYPTAAPPANTAPTVDNITIEPSTAYTNTLLYCNITIYDVDGDTLTAYINWTNGTTHYDSYTKTGASSLDKLNFTLAGTPQHKDEIWNCSASIYDGTVRGAINSTTITILNTVPVSGSVTFDPSTAYTNSTLNGSITITDTDGDNLQTNATWWNGSVAYISHNISSASGDEINYSLAAGVQNKDEVWNISFMSCDDSGDCDEASSAKTIVNSVPTHTNPVLNSSYGTNGTNENLTCYNQSTADAESDTVKNIYNWYRNNISLTVLNMPFENNGTNNGTKDYSSKGNDGSASRAIWDATGGYDGFGAYKFNGTNDHIKLTDDGFDALTEGTIEAWIYSKNLGSTQIIFGAGPGTTSNVFVFYITSSNNSKIWIKGGGPTLLEFNGNTVLQNNNWYHVAFTTDASGNYLYVNGQEETITYDTGDSSSSYFFDDMAAGTTYYDIGTRYYDGGRAHYFNGTIDEVRIYNYSLSANQIKALYNNQTNLIHSSETTGGDFYHCEITPNDETEDGIALNSSELRINNPPSQPTLNYPLNNATGIELNPILNVTITDLDNDAMDVIFYGRQYNENNSNFSIIVLPDTQVYPRDNLSIFTNQTQWIVDNKVDLNIKFVTHVGDLISTGSNSTQWDRANTSISILDDNVPYALLPGNHDFDPNGGATRDTTLFNTYFNYARYESESWYGGHMGNDYDNNYHFFSAGGEDFMILSLEFCPTNETMDWANDTINSNSSRKVIVVTHSYTYSDNTRVDTGDTADCSEYACKGNNGEEMWNNYFKHHNNLILVLSGHVHGVGRLTSTGVNGNSVHQVLDNHQDDPKGGNGYLRIMEFSPDSNLIYVKTYSPYLNSYNTSKDYEFALSFSLAGGTNFTNVENDTNVANGSDASVTWSNLLKNTTYDWHVNITDGVDTIKSSAWNFTTNAAPSLGSITFDPSIAYTNSTLNGSLIITDAEGSSLTTNATWYNGSAAYISMNISSNSGDKINYSLTKGVQAKGETWNISFVSCDDSGDCDEASSAKTISNTVPEPKLDLPTNDTYSYLLPTTFIYNVTDVDGDEIDNCTLWVNGMTSGLTNAGIDTSVTIDQDETIIYTLTEYEELNWTVECIDNSNAKNNATVFIYTLLTEVPEEPDLPSGPGGGSSGGGGGSKSRKEQETTITGTNLVIPYLAHAPLTIIPDDPTLSTYEIIIEIAKEVENIKVDIKEPMNIPVEKPGKEVFRFIQIDSINLPDSFISEVYIKFKVPKSAVKEKVVELQHYKSRWKKLPTKLIKSDDLFNYYEAISPSLSQYFTITLSTPTTLGKITTIEPFIKEGIKEFTKLSKKEIILYGILPLIIIGSLLAYGFYKLIKFIIGHKKIKIITLISLPILILFITFVPLDKNILLYAILPLVVIAGIILTITYLIIKKFNNKSKKKAKVLSKKSRSK